MILAHVAVRQDVVAELLRIAQARAVAEHQPGMRPQHRDVVGDVARVRRTGADVDHGDAAIAGLDQMKGRHLRHALGRRRRSVPPPKRALRVITLPGSTKASAAGLARCHALAAHAREGIDVELIVREDHEVLEVLRIGAGVVVEPVQRVVDAGSAEQRERLRRAGRPLQRAVDDRVVHGGEIGRVEQVAQRPLARRRAGERRRDVDVAPIGEMNRDRLVRLADLDRHAVVLDQQPDLLGEIVAEQIGPRHGRLVHARAGDESVGEPRIEPRVARRW